jgi:hypothetical protein
MKGSLKFRVETDLFDSSTFYKNLTHPNFSQTQKDPETRVKIIFKKRQWQR